MDPVRQHVTTGTRRPRTVEVHQGLTPPPLRQKQLRASAETEVAAATLLILEHVQRFCPRSPRREALIAELERTPRLFTLLATDARTS